MEHTKPEEYLNLEELLHDISDAYVFLDKSWCYRFINSKALQLMTKNKDELIGKTVWEIYPGIIGTVFEENYRKVMEERINITFEAFYLSSNRWLEVRAYAHGNGISIFFSDITEKKKAHEIIADSEKWFRNVADNSPVMIWSANEDMLYNYVNEAWLQFTGHTFEQVAGTGWADDIFEEDKKRVLELYTRAFDQKVNFRTEYRLRHRDGNYRWITHAGNPFYTPDKTFQGYTGTCIDVDEQVMVYQDLEKKISARTAELTAALEREKELNNLKSHLVSLASHELRTPLSTMLSSVGLMEQYHAINQPLDMVKHLGRIRMSINHMINILNDFLSLDKVEQGQVKVEHKAINLQEFFREIAEELSPTLKKGQEIVCTYNGPKKVFTDKNIIHNVLMNLLSNAIKYSETDIKVSIRVSDTQIDMAITDDGIGIPETDQPMLFHKYFRASNVGNVKGIGLGLNIVQRHIELLNGKISFISVAGKGTTFYVELPNIQERTSQQLGLQTVRN